MSAAGAALGARLRERDVGAAPAALNLLESTAAGDRAQAAELLAEVSPARLGGEAPAHVIGLTGPPGAGKSTLLSALLRAWRERGRTVAILAVDPSSRRSGRKAGSDDPKAVARALESGEAVETVMGPVKFDGKGDIKDPRYDINQWKEGKYAPIAQ